MTTTQPSERKHTPGPWTLYYEGTIYGDGESEWVCSFPWKSFKEFNEGNNAATARLITAAPDLYEALTELVRRCPFIPVENGIQAAISPQQIRLARAALAKAEGRTP